jgi:hypothetical protein
LVFSATTFSLGGACKTPLRLTTGSPSIKESTAIPSFGGRGCAEPFRSEGFCKRLLVMKNEPLAKPPRPAWKPALHWRRPAISVASWRVGFHPDRLPGGFARGSNLSASITSPIAFCSAAALPVRYTSSVTLRRAT